MLMRAIPGLFLLLLPQPVAALAPGDFICTYSEKCRAGEACEDVDLALQVQATFLGVFVGKPPAPFTGPTKGTGNAAFFSTDGEYMIGGVHAFLFDSDTELGFINVTYVDHETSEARAVSIWSSGRSTYSVSDALQMGTTLHNGDCVPASCRQAAVDQEVVTICEAIN